MKSYILNLTGYGLDALPASYDYETASLLWDECDELNESLSHHTVTLTETESGSLILAAEVRAMRETSPTGPESLSAGFRRSRISIERLRLSRALERIADEYGAFELPARFLMGEPELNELLSCS